MRQNHRFTFSVLYALIIFQNQEFQNSNQLTK